MDDIGPVKDLLRKHDYQVRLNFERGKLTCNFPRRVTKPVCEPFTQIYEPTKDGVFITGGDDKKELVKTARYALRTIMFTDIAKTCRAIGFNTNLISFNVNRKEVDFVTFKNSLLSPKLTKGQLEKEETLDEYVGIGTANGFTDELFTLAKANRVDKELKIIQGILIGRE